MKAIDIMPLPLERELKQLGAGIAIARRRRRITMALMLKRSGLSKRTYQMIEKGDPRVAMGAYAMSLFALGLSGGISALADPGKDAAGLLLEADRLPKRVRATKPGKAAP
ncbi:MAG: hypothetical protein ACREC3_01395 [Methyloceanibacter sp.]